MNIDKWRCAEMCNDDEKQIFAANMRYLQMDSGLNRQEFADFLGISIATLQTWIRGAAMPMTPEKLKEIASLFNLTPEQLVSAGYRMRQDAMHGYIRSLDEIYPYNVVIAALNWNYGYEEKDGALNPDGTICTDYEEVDNISIWTKMPPRYIFDLINSLNPRQSAAIEYYYRDGLSMKEIGTRLDITVTRVGQIIRLAQRTIRSRLSSLRCVPEKDYVKLQKVVSDLENQLAIAKMKNGEPVEPRTIPPKDVSIIDLNMSVRTTNCLKRAGLLTMQDIIDFDRSPKDSWLSIRNLGRGSLRELYATCKDWGYPLSDNKIPEQYRA